MADDTTKVWVQIEREGEAILCLALDAVQVTVDHRSEYEPVYSGYVVVEYLCCDRWRVEATGPTLPCDGSRGPQYRRALREYQAVLTVLRALEPVARELRQIRSLRLYLEWLQHGDEAIGGNDGV